MLKCSPSLKAWFIKIKCQHKRETRRNRARQSTRTRQSSSTTWSQRKRRKFWIRLWTTCASGATTSCSGRSTITSTSLWRCTVAALIATKRTSAKPTVFCVSSVQASAVKSPSSRAAPIWTPLLAMSWVRSSQLRSPRKSLSNLRCRCWCDAVSARVIWSSMLLSKQPEQGHLKRSSFPKPTRRKWKSY